MCVSSLFFVYITVYHLRSIVNIQILHKLHTTKCGSCCANMCYFYVIFIRTIGQTGAERSTWQQ